MLTLTVVEDAQATQMKALLIACSAMLTGCYGISTVAPDGAVVRHYFGYIRVVVPASHTPQGHVSSSDAAGVGVRIQNGLLIGAFRDKDLVLPLDCRFVMLVRSKEELDWALRTMSLKVPSEDLCLAVSQP